MLYMFHTISLHQSLLIRSSSHLGLFSCCSCYLFFPIPFANAYTLRAPLLPYSYSHMYATLIRSTPTRPSSSEAIPTTARMTSSLSIPRIRCAAPLILVSVLNFLLCPVLLSRSLFFFLPQLSFIHTRAHSLVHSHLIITYLFVLLCFHLFHLSPLVL